MKYSGIFQVMLIAIVFGNCMQTPDDKSYVVLQGKVIDRNSSALLLKKSTEDARYQGLEIAISDSGYFEYHLDKPLFMEEFELVFKDEHEKGMWRPIPFYPESDTIRFELYPMEQFDQNKIIGSESSMKMETMDAAYQSNFESDFKQLYSEMDSLEQIDPNVGELVRIQENLDSLRKKAINWRLIYFQEHPDIFSYIRFLDLLKQVEPQQAYYGSLERTYDVFSKMYPEHPYTVIASNLLNGLNHIKVGGQFVDFTAHDSTGKEIAISSYIIQNKLTLVDLWAPWCGPCIKKGKAVQKIYNEMKPFGFEVIAVIGGIKVEEEYFKAMARHNYPWEMLMELQNENRIWEKYNISNAGGGQFLIDRKGKILAINPNIEEIRSIVNESSLN